MFLVTGATGNIGSALVANLAEAGESVRALVRDPARAALPSGVDAVAGDLTAPESLADAFDGVRAAFVLPGYPGVVAAAAKSGVRHIVLLSGTSAGTGHDSNAVTRYMAASEQEVTDSGLSWTILRPSAFMSNALRWLPQLRAGDVVRAQFPTVPIAVLDPADLAAVAARALTTDHHRGEILWPTGPQALRPAEQIAILGQVLSRPLTCVELSNDETRAEMLATTSPEYVDAFFDFYVDGAIDESVVRDTVERVTGRPPRTFADWAAAHADSFR
ncbi:NAD(P)H-binding protein [Nocardia blacklockiae]|uniref:NAD(P)H-binding protein n=1 Tax=Nocardia blacklockiae TaxID=480036 RepID=UPI00189540A8|nr:NAD(P)H-binding protein [Nocardia blacklockiae]MBF6170792.1 NAD(P)H-binding protein [Nocardia blacklockiae]